MVQQSIHFVGEFSSGACNVVLIFRRNRLARVEYCRNFGDKTKRVRDLWLLPNYVLASDWRTRCIAIWYLSAADLAAIDFAVLGIDRAVVDNCMMVDGRLAIKNCA